MNLSIAMCTYNGAKYLRAQLESIASQRLVPAELVVCDDGSTDSTPEMLQAFAVNAPFPVRLYRNETNLGPSQNFAKAIGLCSGEIVALADQDDEWLPQKLERLVSEFRARPEAGLVFSDAEVMGQDSRLLGYRAWESTWVEFGGKERQLFEDSKALDLLLTRNIVTGATIAFRSEFKDLILPIPAMERVFLHDYWIALMVAAVSTLAWISEPLIRYRRHVDQHQGVLPPGARNMALVEPGDFRRANPRRDLLMEAVRERLASRNSTTDNTQAIAKLEHFQVRSGMNRTSFAGRLRQAVRELSRGHYRLYSDGLNSALEDISMPHRLLQFRSFMSNLLKSQTRRN
jgi:hypothetical protein